MNPKSNNTVSLQLNIPKSSKIFLLQAISMNRKVNNRSSKSNNNRNKKMNMKNRIKSNKINWSTRRNMLKLN